MKRVTTNPARVEEICTRLVGAFERDEFPYNIGTEPQELIPPHIKVDPLKHSLFLFGACFFMRGTIQSDYAFKQLLAIYDLHPELYDPRFLSGSDIDNEYVFVRFKPFIKYRLFEIAKIWLDGFRRLQEDWDGDPRNIFVGVHDADELYRRAVNIQSHSKWKKVPNKLRGFMGYRAKIANMLAYFLMEAHLVEEFVTSSPFDFHNARVFLGGEAIVLEGDAVYRYEDVADIGSGLVETYCRAHGVATKKVAAALWVLSTTLCRNAPGNRTLNRTKSKEGNKREGERHTLEYKPQQRKEQPDLLIYTPDWSDAKDVQEHELSCGLCPVRDLCTLNVASGFYYEDGSFRTQPRTEPLPHLFEKEGLKHQRKLR